jgi:hypothetical protein
MYLPQTVFVVVDEGPKGETRLADPADVFGPEEGDCAIQTCMMHKDDVSHRAASHHTGRTYVQDELCGQPRKVVLHEL